MTGRQRGGKFEAKLEMLMNFAQIRTKERAKSKLTNNLK